MRSLTAAFLAAILSPLLCPAAPFQDDPPAEMKWTLTEGDRFDLKWAYSETRNRQPGQGPVTEFHDKRDVDAELAWKADGILTLTLKKVVWSYGSQDYEVTAVYSEGKKFEPKQVMKMDPKAAGFNVSKAEADRMVEYLKKINDGDLGVNTIDEKGRTVVTRNGSNVRSGGMSLLDHIYTHPLLPLGPVRMNQIFKDPLEVTNLPAGLVEIKTVESKVTAVGAGGLIAKGGVNVPVGKTFTANGQTQNMSGNFTYTCEWNYHPKGFLQGSKEESKFTKKVDAKGKDADFYRENFTHIVSQVLSIKKKESKPGEPKKPEEKPPGEKPEEKPGEKPEEKK